MIENMLKRILIIVFYFSILPGCAQAQKQDYLGNWIGKFPDKNCFNFQIALEKIGSNDYHVLIRNSRTLIDHTFNSNEVNQLTFSIEEQLHFKLNSNSDTNSFKGYLKTGKLYYFIELKKTEQNKYIGRWNPLMLDNELISDELFLNVDHYNNQLEAYLTSQAAKTSGNLSPDETAVFLKFWKSNKVKIHESLLKKIK